ncbi:gamma-glutamyl-gamma-aminobutyrate hydrolase [Mycolicibacterium litorale]|nr:gamma-glutamyl-gamma-aminobutyrate hydrolase [Mycolicibacterium litorale]
MRRPLVAVVGRRAEQVPILRFSATVVAEAICEAVWAAGGEPMALHGPAADPYAELPERIAQFDAVLLPGGADVEPHRYGARAQPQTRDTVAFQDDLDLAVTRTVLALQVPTLAICRGMQILNIALGGTLVQHLPQSSTAHHDAVHDVTVLTGSRLHTVVGSERIAVSSYHHQAVDQLGAGLTVSAVAADGVVEAVEHPDADIVAVQWHPEDRHACSAPDAALFADLVVRAATRRESR